MAATTLKFVFQDDTTSPAGGAQSAAPGASRNPQPAEDATPGQAAKQANRSRARGATPDDVAAPGKSGAQAVGDAITGGLGKQLERLPFFGQALRLLGEIAAATGGSVAIKGGQDLLRALFTRAAPAPPPANLGAARNAEKEALANVPADLRVRSSPGAASGANYPSSREAARRTAENQNRSDREVDEALRREAEARRPIGLDSGPPPSPGRATSPPIPPAALGRAARGAQPVITGPATAAAGAGAAGGGGAAGGAAGAVAGAAAALGPVGVTILAGVAVVGAAIVATRALIAANESLRKHIAEVADRLRPFSAEIQAADARIEIAKLKQDIEQANQNGGRVGRFQEAQARIDRGLSRIAAAVEGPLLDAVTPLVEHVAGVLEIASKGFSALTTIANNLGFLKPNFIRLLEVQNKLLGFAQDESNQLPPEADILGAFSREPDLTINFQGRIFAGDGDELQFGRLQFANPLPIAGFR